MLLRERLSRAVLIALVCAVAGTGLLVGIDVNGAALTGDRLLGATLALGSALGYAVLTLVGRRLAGDYHPLVPTTYGFTAGALVLLPFALAGGLTISYPALGWGLLLWLGLGPTALGYVLFMRGMRTTPATVASIVTLLEPLVSTALAVLLFEEQLGAFGGLGAALLLGAIVALYRSRG
jgi:drug/metabolite transporter, DME family